MLIQITDNGGTDTFLYEEQQSIALNMIRYFIKVGLKSGLIPDYEPMYSKRNFDYVANNTRSMYLKNEYKKFGNPAPALRIVK